VYALLYTYFQTDMVREKTQKLKAFLKLMGATNFNYWLSWIITMSIGVSIVAILMLAGTLGTNIFSGPTTLGAIVLMLVYIFPTITFALLAATVASSAQVSPQ